MKTSIRSVVLGLALLAAIAASFMDVPGQRESPEVASGSPAPAARRASLPPDTVPVATGDMSSRRWGPPAQNLFAGRAAPVRIPLATMPEAPASAAVPAAPPLPFVYQGKLLEHDRVTAFLSLGPRTYLLRKGDLVSDYRVVDIHPAGMTFVYLPLNLEQRLSFGSAN